VQTQRAGATALSCYAPLTTVVTCAWPLKPWYASLLPALCLPYYSCVLSSSVLRLPYRQHACQLCQQYISSISHLSCLDSTLMAMMFVTKIPSQLLCVRVCIISVSMTVWVMNCDLVRSFCLALAFQQCFLHGITLSLHSLPIPRAQPTLIIQVHSS